MRPPSLLGLIAAHVLPVLCAAICQDDADGTLASLGGDCELALAFFQGCNGPIGGIGSIDEGTVVRDLCPVSCGTCTEDDPCLPPPEIACIDDALEIVTTISEFSPVPLSCAFLVASRSCDFDPGTLTEEIEAGIFTLSRVCRSTCQSCSTTGRPTPNCDATPTAPTKLPTNSAPQATNSPSSIPSSKSPSSIPSSKSPSSATTSKFPTPSSPTAFPTAPPSLSPVTTSRPSNRPPDTSPGKDNGLVRSEEGSDKASSKPESEDVDGAASNLGIIIACSIGALIIIAFVALLAMRRRRRRPLSYRGADFNPYPGSSHNGPIAFTSNLGEQELSIQASAGSFSPKPHPPEPQDESRYKLRDSETRRAAVPSVRTKSKLYGMV